MSLFDKMFSFLYKAPKKQEQTLVEGIDKDSDSYQEVADAMKEFKEQDSLIIAPLRQISSMLRTIDKDLNLIKNELIMFREVIKNQNTVLLEVVEETARLANSLDMLLSNVEDYERSEGFDDKDEEVDDDDDLEKNKKRKLGIN